VGHTFGHEFTGVVEEMGRDVDNLQVGDRVVVPFPIACGICWFCQRGFFANCAQSNPSNDLVAGVYGYSHTTGGYDGGQAQYVRVPYANVGPMKIPEDMDDESVLFLSDILPTGYQAAEMAEIEPGETVVVFGCGPVGLFAMRSAWLMGAGRVIAVDHVPYRLEVRREVRPGETLNLREDRRNHRDQGDDRGTGRGCLRRRGGLEAAGSAGQRAIGVYGKMTAARLQRWTWRSMQSARAAISR
jgi:threonine dehydrogenase-like Zn-dependent dehydrogenase